MSALFPPHLRILTLARAGSRPRDIARALNREPAYVSDVLRKLRRRDLLPPAEKYAWSPARRRGA